MPLFANATTFPTRNAKQRSELLRQYFMSQCEIFDPDMMVFVDDVIDALPCASLDML